MLIVEVLNLFAEFLYRIMELLSKNFLFGYLTGMNSFPKPLNKEEEAKYIKKLHEGDPEARNVLIERNLRLVAHIVKKYSQYSKDSDDLISIGTIGLIKAISNFDPNKNVRLATYAIRCIENEILMHLRTQKKSLSDLSLQEPVGVDKEGNEVSLMDLLGNDSDSISEQVELKIEVKKLYKSINHVLKDREKVVIERRYGLCGNEAETQKKIGNSLGISRSYVSRIEKKALKKLYKAMKNKNEN